MLTAPLTAVSLERFAAEREPGAEALLGHPDDALIAQGTDAMVYGDGGAGKTTLMLDAALHLAAGDTWLGMPVARPARVLMVENEGGRPLFRKKAARRLAGWTGSAICGRVQIIDSPWSELLMTDDAALDELAKLIARDEIDVLIAGPVSALGFTENGTIPEVRAFMQRIAALRSKSGRALAVVLIHHEAKGGTISGAWEGAADTILHVSSPRRGHTILSVKKVRWSSSLVGATMRLDWTPGESFAPAGARAERDLADEIEQLQADGEWRDAEEIRRAIKARKADLQGILTAHFQTASDEQAKALGRSPRAILYGRRFTRPNGRVESGRVGASGEQDSHSTHSTELKRGRGGSSRVVPGDSLDPTPRSSTGGEQR